jgi:hypothetical protein
MVSRQEFSLVILILQTNLSCKSEQKKINSEPDSAIDTSVVEECNQGIVLQNIEGLIEPGQLISFGETPAQGPSLRIDFDIYNPCQEKVRFLGHPDDWIVGQGFLFETLPSVALDGESYSTMSVNFQPPEEGLYQGSVSLPHTFFGSPFEFDLEAISSPPLTLVFVGDGRHTATTLDYGYSFAYDHFETLIPNSNLMQNGVCYGNSHFVAVGGFDRRGVWISEDGILWEDGSTEGEAIFDCAFGNGIFVAINSFPLVSIDGFSWVLGEVGNSTNKLQSIAFGNDIFVSVGEQGRITTTIDGLKWDSDVEITSHNLHKVMFGDGRFVAIGDNGTVSTSIDGVQWVTKQVGNGSRWNGVVYVDDYFLIGNGSQIMKSSDGRQWELLTYSSIVPVLSIGSMMLGMGGNVLYRSEDDGYNWVSLYSFAAGLSLTDVSLSLQ